MIAMTKSLFCSPQANNINVKLFLIFLFADNKKTHQLILILSINSSASEMLNKTTSSQSTFCRKQFHKLKSFIKIHCIQFLSVYDCDDKINVLRTEAMFIEWLHF